MNAIENVARMARDEARARRRVLIVTRNAFIATRVVEALERTLRPRDGDATILRGQGLWSARSASWDTGRIDVRVAGPAVRGRTDDTVFIDSSISSTQHADAWHTVTGAAPSRVVW